MFGVSCPMVTKNRKTASRPPEQGSEGNVHSLLCHCPAVKALRSHLTGWAATVVVAPFGLDRLACVQKALPFTSQI
jgi:hypothetical protein